MGALFAFFCLALWALALEGSWLLGSSDTHSLAKQGQRKARFYMRVVKHGPARRSGSRNQQSRLGMHLLPELLSGKSASQVATMTCDPNPTKSLEPTSRGQSVSLHAPPVPSHVGPAALPRCTNAQLAPLQLVSYPMKLPSRRERVPKIPRQAAGMHQVSQGPQHGGSACAASLGKTCLEA
uniref:Uncharacterized protein n=1 Tax=Ustilaginoidea virens TaxID=1159556 RepID=A0A1X9WE78_USTVR|nr:hypothetical protein [Ustilaginoidea virens]